MTISDFFEKSSGLEPYLDKTVSPKIISQLINDIEVSPGKVEFIGIMKTEYNMFSEYHILYKFPKDSIGLGSYIKALGTKISRIPLGDEISSIGIQEVDSARPDRYYVMIYALS